MTSSELRYLITINKLCCGDMPVSLMKIAAEMKVSKVSVYKAVERLGKDGRVERTNRKVIITDKGKAILGEYMLMINFLCSHLTLHCVHDEAIAFNDAINAVCVLSDTGRDGIVTYLKTLGAV